MRWLSLIALGLMLFIGTVRCAVQSPPRQPSAVVMRYEDFGPPSMVYELIGFDFWQWQSHGDPDPTKKYPIKVVVYRGMTLDEVKSRYPVDPTKNLDFRYLSFTDAMKHLDEQIADDALPTLTEQLRATRDALRTKFGESLAGQAPNTDVGPARLE